MTLTIVQQTWFKVTSLPKKHFVGKVYYHAGPRGDKNIIWKREFGWTDGRTNGQTDNKRALAVWGIKNS